MNTYALSFSSVIRWLLTVVGCVVLETTQPMIAQETTESSPAERADDTLIYPSSSAPPQGESLVVPSAASRSGWVFAILVGFGAAGFWWWQRHRASQGPLGQANGLLVEQSRSLGNRQFLVVAGCDGRRFLLGVTSGQINPLAELDRAPDPTDDSHD